MKFNFTIEQSTTDQGVTTFVLLDGKDVVTNADATPAYFTDYEKAAKCAHARMLVKLKAA